MVQSMLSICETLSSIPRKERKEGRKEERGEGKGRGGEIWATEQKKAVGDARSGWDK